MGPGVEGRSCTAEDRSGRSGAGPYGFFLDLHPHVSHIEGTSARGMRSRPINLSVVRRRGPGRPHPCGFCDPDASGAHGTPPVA